jgi:glycosyltransferase involved in cell wall biosynthesis
MPQPTVPRVAFVNGGILGLLSYATWLQRVFPDARDLRAEHFILSQDLTVSERVLRRVLNQRLWPDWPGSRNADLARFRGEWNAGLQARRRLLRRGLDHFDVLHFHRQATAYASLDLMRRRPSIVSMDCTQSCMLNDATSAIERMALQPNVRRDGEIFRRAAIVVSTSEWAKRELRRMYPGCATPIQVMPNPVALDLFDAGWTSERRNRTGRPRCLFIGGDFPRKGGPLLLSVWAEGGFGSRADLTIVTDWPVPEPLPPGVRVVRGVRGQTPAWVDIWRSADIFVMPTHNEAFGLVYQEAAGAGLPAIGSRLNAIPEIIAEGETGLLVDHRNPRELAEALDRLIGSAELRERFGRAARARIESEADPDRHRQWLLEIIMHLAVRHG